MGGTAEQAAQHFITHVESEKRSLDEAFTGRAGDRGGDQVGIGETNRAPPSSSKGEPRPEEGKQVGESTETNGVVVGKGKAGLVVRVVMNGRDVSI